MPTLPTLVLLTATATTALIAGLFFAYSCSVNPGLHALSDLAYLSAMQSINRAILNPAFLLCFLGTAVMLPVSAGLYFQPAATVRFWLLAAAAGIYGMGVLGVTMAGNVPLNESLAAIDLTTATSAELTTYRAAFEPRWNHWHTLRTVASGLALVLAVAACLCCPAHESV